MFIHGGMYIHTEGTYIRRDINTEWIYIWKNKHMERHTRREHTYGGTHTEGYIHGRTYTRRDTYIEEIDT